MDRQFIQNFEGGYIARNNSGKYLYVVDEKTKGTYDTVDQLVKENISGNQSVQSSDSQVLGADDVASKTPAKKAKSSK